MSKRLSKYISSFNYFDKLLIVLSVTTGTISITSFAVVVGVLLGMMCASCSLAFSSTTGIVKNLLKTAKIKRKSAIKFLCWLEVN